jgi:cysteinyl-tRNA synthetase
MALTIIYDLLKADMNGATKLKAISDFDYVLSLNLLATGNSKEEKEANDNVDDELTAFVLAKIEERAQAKKAKDFATADAIRDELMAKGIEIKDTREGVVWNKL